MKEIEILGLILMLYDYEPNLKGFSIQNDDYKWSLVGVIRETNNFLKRKGYFNEDFRPTIKFYQLLQKYDVKIEQLKEYQEEYAKTGHITQYDKLGNKQVL